MSRSYKKTPVTKIASCKSEKKDKTLANRKFRAMEKEAIRNGEDPIVNKNEASNVWDFAGDGKMYMSNVDLLDWDDESKRKLFKK